MCFTASGLFQTVALRCCCIDESFSFHVSCCHLLSFKQVQFFTDSRKLIAHPMADELLSKLEHVISECEGIVASMNVEFKVRMMSYCFDEN